MNFRLELGSSCSRAILTLTFLSMAGCAQHRSVTSTQTVVVTSPPVVASALPQSSAGLTLSRATSPSAPPLEILGSGRMVGTPRLPGGTPTQDNGITLNFVNADVSAVAQTIFGELLKENYTVDAGVQGTITLQTTRPLAREAVIPALETSLQMANLALTREADGYHIVPMASAAQAGAGNIAIAGGTQTPGYGYEIIPLKYANATAVERLIQPLAQSGVQIQVDATRNLLIVAGSSQEREAIAENVAVFDVDWLSGMSYALIPMQTASASAVAKEVGDIIGGKESPMTGLVRLVVISRLNAILVITPQERYLAEVKDWIARLDQQQESADRQVFIYRVQNGVAKDIAAVLSDLLNQSSSNSNSTKNSSDQGSGSQDSDASNSGAPGPQLPTAAENNAQGNSDNGQSDDDQTVTDSTTTDQSPRITADDTNNALLIYATPDQYRSLENALMQLDVEPKQVMLEAVVAEVTLTNQLQYGVQYYLQSGRVQSVNTVGTTNAIAQAFPGFSAVLSPGQNIQIALNALESITHVDVISAPRLLVLNNQAAELQVGDEVPITTQTAESTTTSGAPLVSTIQYQPTGVILHVTPRINEGGLVTLDLSQEVSDVSTTTSSSLNSPTITERKITSVVAVQDGETVALGGLISNSVTSSNNGIPYLDRIPLLGDLFSTKNNTGTRTELLVLITPHVVQSVDEMQAVTDELKSELKAVPLSP